MPVSKLLSCISKNMLELRIYSDENDIIEYSLGSKKIWEGGDKQAMV